MSLGLGYDRLGKVILCYVNLKVICATNENHICNQDLTKPHYQQHLCLNWVACLSIIFTTIPLQSLEVSDLIGV